MRRTPQLDRALAAVEAGATTTTTLRAALQCETIQAAQNLMRRLEAAGLVERVPRTERKREAAVGLGVYAARPRDNSVLYRITDSGLAS